MLLSITSMLNLIIYTKFNKMKTIINSEQIFGFIAGLVGTYLLICFIKAIENLINHNFYLNF